MRARVEYAGAACVLAVTLLLVAAAAPFSTHLAARTLEATRARFYLSQSVCTDAAVAAQLGPVNLCDTSAHVLAVPPWARAVSDTAATTLAPLAAAVPRGVWVLAALGALVAVSWLRNAARLAPPRAWDAPPPKWVAAAHNA